MKYIKTYEINAIEKVKNLQDKKLAALKFSNKIREIFDKFFNKKVKFSEEASPNGVILTYDLRYSGHIICKIYIKEMFIELNFSTTSYQEFDKFIYKFLDIKTQFSIYKTLTTSELNDYSNRIVDEFELENNMKKYNI